MPDVESTAELGVLTRQMADAYGERLTEPPHLRAMREAVNSLGPDASLVDLQNALLVAADADGDELEKAFLDSMFQAGAIGLVSAPVPAGT